MDRSWTFGVCESCLKNCHSRVKMVREVLRSEYSDFEEEVWVCPKCGASKKF